MKLENDMHTVYYRQKDGGVYALDTATGKARNIGPTEWARVQNAYKAAGVRIPFADEYPK
jgi:hypothetical protein